MDTSTKRLSLLMHWGKVEKENNEQKIKEFVLRSSLLVNLKATQTESHQNYHLSMR